MLYTGEFGISREELQPHHWIMRPTHNLLVGHAPLEGKERHFSVFGIEDKVREREVVSIDVTYLMEAFNDF